MFSFIFKTFIYLFIINYNTITNKNILIIYQLSNFDRVLGVVSQATVSDGNRTHDLTLIVWHTAH